jgi:tripartite ATP-independent transporter DctP family solute receptor
MKKLGALFLGLCIMLMLTACGSDDEAITLILAENQVDDYPTSIGDYEFARLIEEKTNGRYKVDVYTGGQLGDEKSVIELMQVGAIEIARVNASPLMEFSGDLGVLSLPYLFSSDEHKWDVLNGEIGRELLDNLSESNLQGLAFYDSGSRHFYNSIREVKTPEDLNGLKIRVQQSSMNMDMVEAFDASATPMAYSEVYSAMQTGVIDGAENNLPSYYTTNHYEVAKFLTLDAHSGVPEVLTASKALWDDLSEEDRAIFIEAALESQKVQRKAWAELEEKAVKEIKAQGNTVTEITDIAAWQKRVEPLYEKYGSKYAKNLERIRALSSN